MFDNSIALSIMFISFYQNHSALIPSNKQKLLRTAPNNMFYNMLYFLFLYKHMWPPGQGHFLTNLVEIH